MAKFLLGSICFCAAFLSALAASSVLHENPGTDGFDQTPSRQPRTIRVPATLLNNIINIFVSFILDTIYALRSAEYDFYYIIGRYLPGPFGRFFLSFAGYPSP